MSDRIIVAAHHKVEATMEIHRVVVSVTRVLTTEIRTKIGIVKGDSNGEQEGLAGAQAVTQEGAKKS